jgi:hypothetical protein
MLRESAVHLSRDSFRVNDMRLAFVIRLGSDSRPADGIFEGWVEEVDTCTERRFHSAEELLAFLGQCFDLANSSTDIDRSDSGGQLPCGKKPSPGGK